jgi:hypothetical protein
MRALNAGLARSAVLALLFVLAGSRAASARERLAVAIVAADDAELGDNLTEAAISTLAERGDDELVGTRELRRRLADDPSAPELEICVVQPACVARIAAAVGARRAVVGEVHRQEAGYLIQLALASSGTGAREADWSRQVPGDVQSLVGAIATGVRALFAAKAASPNGAAVPLTRAPVSLPARDGAPALHLEAAVPANRDSSRHGNARAGYLGVTALGLAVIAFSAAAVAGNTAEAPVIGTTRAEMQADLQRREGYASVANGLLAAGVALSLTAGTLFAWWWRSERPSNP